MLEPHLQLIAATFPAADGAPRVLPAVLAARRLNEDGILEAVAITRSGDGAIRVLGAAEREPRGFAVSPVMARAVALLEPRARGKGTRNGRDPAAWRRAARQLDTSLRATAELLTPSTSALVAIVAPAGAAEVVGAVIDDACKLAVEDLPIPAVRALSDDPPVFFAGLDALAAAEAASPADSSSPAARTLRPRPG